MGVRFFIDKLIKLKYHSSQPRNDDVTTSPINSLRRSLGHPISTFHTIQCLVTSMDGMNSLTFPEKAIVPSQLTTGGITIEKIS